jgi:hypothetical protein
MKSRKMMYSMHVSRKEMHTKFWSENLKEANGKTKHNGEDNIK